MAQPHLFICAPAYQESEGIEVFVQTVRKVLETSPQLGEGKVHLIAVDDGSKDSTYKEIQKACRTHSGGRFEVIGLRLSRNFGQQAAFQAALEYSFRLVNEKYSSEKKDCYWVLMDSDLQHPPELIDQMLERLKTGIPHIQMRRTDGQETGIFKRLTSRTFYFLFRKTTGIDMHAGSSDFRAFSYPVLNAYLKMTERGRFNRGLFYWIGFERLEIPYQVGKRHAGKTKFSARKMASLFLTAMTQFSSKPLTLITGLAMILSFVICAAYFVWEGWRYSQGEQFVLGWPSLMAFVAFWSGTILLTQFILSVYVSRIFDEIKARPVYLIAETTLPILDLQRDTEVG